MTTDEGRELLCNIQGPIAARLIAISQARFAAGGSTNIISIFRRSSRPICRSPDSLQEMAGPPPSPCASHSNGRNTADPSLNQTCSDREFSLSVIPTRPGACELLGIEDEHPSVV